MGRSRGGIEAKGLVDRQGRRLTYLRLSVTDRCDLQCSYCRAGAAQPPAGPALTYDEIVTLGVAFANRLGFRKVRLTGGEPLLRADLERVVRGLRDHTAFRRIALTTNGRLLAGRSRSLRDAGLDQVNVSLDTLCTGSYKEIRGADALDDVLAGIDRALEARYRKVKVNIVLLRSGLGEFDGFLAWGRGKKIEIRFIELMPTESNRELYEREHAASTPLLERILAEGFMPVPLEGDGGPAVVYQRLGDPLRVGFVAAISEPFCAACNRLRVTAEGALKLCLFQEGSIDLRPALAEGPDATAEIVRRAVALREDGNRPTGRVICSDRGLSNIGG